MAGTAEFSFRQLVHVHLVLPSGGHRERFVVAAIAPQAFEIDVKLMLKENVSRAFGFVFDVSTSDFRGNSQGQENQQEQYAAGQSGAHHDSPHFV